VCVCVYVCAHVNNCTTITKCAYDMSTRCKRTHTHAHAHAHTHTHACTHTHKHTYIHTQTTIEDIAVVPTV
jgi:hypothetical protein